jgi:hypothetical protein
MTALPEVPGIIEGDMTITGSQTAGCLRQALAVTEIRQAAARTTDELPTFPCHIGFSHNSVNSAP